MRKLVGGLLAASAVVALVAWFRRAKKPPTGNAVERPGSAHLPAPRTAQAYDPTAMEVAARVEVNAERQSVIDSILRSHGGQPARRIIPALRAALLANGLSADPDSWLRAVATELANGHVYMVSQSSVDTYVTQRQLSH